MDDADRAEINRQREIDNAIANAQPKRMPKPTGWCHYCKEDVGPGQRWCDADCSGWWERENG